MPSNTTAQDESGDRIPRWAATAGHHPLGQRLTALGARLFRSRAQANSDETELPWMAANHYLDVLTIEAITALQREVNEALREEGYPAHLAELAFVWVRPVPARKLWADHSSPRTDGSPRQSLPTGDDSARNPHRPNGQPRRQADDVASSPGSG